MQSKPGLYTASKVRYKVAMTQSSPDVKATLLVTCPDRAGIVARVTNFIFEHQGNILTLSEHGEGDGGGFFMRLVWSLEGFALSREETTTKLEALSNELGMRWRLTYSDVRPKIAVFVSKEDHCLYDLMHAQKLGELAGDVALVISNHESLKHVADHFSTPFAHVPISKATKPEAEAAQRKLLDEHGIQLVVLARYMQILSKDFAEAWAGKAINIHHSFLPSFMGANPYRQAKERGVKIIGATAHYVTPDLDEGPIVEQNVTRVTHRDSVADMRRKGRDLERQVLTHAVRLHLQNRIIISGNRTIVFH